MNRVHRNDVIALDAARTAARRALADQIAHSRSALSPHHLATVWRAQQVRRLSRAGERTIAIARRHRGPIAATAAGLVALAAAIPLIRRARRAHPAQPQTIPIATEDRCDEQ